MTHGSRAWGLSQHEFAHSVHHVANAADRLHFLIRNIDIEFVFEGEDDIDAIHGVDAQFFEGTLDGDLGHVLALGLGDNSQDAPGQVVFGTRGRGGSAGDHFIGHMS